MYCADAEHSDLPIKGLLDEKYGQQRASLINMKKAQKVCTAGNIILLNAAHCWKECNFLQR